MTCVYSNSKLLLCNIRLSGAYLPRRAIFPPESRICPVYFFVMKFGLDRQVYGKHRLRSVAYKLMIIEKNWCAQAAAGYCHYTAPWPVSNCGRKCYHHLIMWMEITYLQISWQPYLSSPIPRCCLIHGYISRWADEQLLMLLKHGG